MKIFVESEPIIKQKSGVGYYTYNLLNALQETDKKNEYGLLFWRLFLKNNPLKIKNKNFYPKFFWLLPSYKIYYKLFILGLKIPINLAFGTPDIYFFTNFLSLPLFKAKSIIVIYDLSYIKYPDFSDPVNAKILKRLAPKSISKADYIITISKNSKKEIMEFYNVPEDKITIIYPAVDKDKFKPAKPEEIDKIKSKYKIKGDYLLFTSTLEPRKNIEGIVASYVLLPQEIKDEYSLVLAGGKGWQDEELLKEIEKAKSEGNNIIQTGYVPEEDLPALYSGASLFLFPSFYEGFGIPILEAIACGTPVVTSNISSMPEVAGDAAILVNPESTEEIKEAIIKVLSDNNLREDMKRKGFNQSKKFSWEDSAKKLVEVFEKVHGEKK